MKNRINKLWKYLAAAVLGVLGFSSCGEQIEPLVMYGTPQADFKAYGKVKDEAGKPIEGIRVAVRQGKGNEFEADTFYSDTKGEWLFKKNYIRLPGELTIIFEDIDGKEHGGEFKSAEAKPEIKQTADGDGSWYKGAYEAKADVILKKK